jgi:hypothetical protein
MPPGGPSNRAKAPGQRHHGFHGGIILTPSFDEAPEGREGTGGGAHQPRLQGASGTVERVGTVAGCAGSCTGVGVCVC